MALKSYNILSLGAGVQSSTIALMADKGTLLYEGKPLDIDFAVFADTGAEPQNVYEWLDYLQSQIKSFKIYRVSDGDLMAENLRPVTNNNILNVSIPFFTISKNNKNKGMLQRRCTRNHKIRPIIKFIKNKLKIRQFRKYERVIINPKLGYIKGNIKYNVTYPDLKLQQIIGISLDEFQRMKPSGEKWIENIYPLIDMKMTRQDCLEWMKSNNYPTPPRSSCVFCPYHSDYEWNNLKLNNINDFNKAVEFEKQISLLVDKDKSWEHSLFLHRKRLPLDQIEFDTADKERNNFNNECEGMCGN